MKYIFLALVFCFLWAFNMAAMIEYYEIKMVKNRDCEKKLVQCEDEKIAANREINEIWKEKNKWVGEAVRLKEAKRKR